MKTFLRFLVRFWGILAIACAATCTIFFARGFTSPDKFDWPAWIQAVGSVAAILAAIWVSADQATQQRRRELSQQNSETKGVLRSLAAELESTIQYAITAVIVPMQSRQPGQPFRYTVPMSVQPFPIFDALIPRLSLITEDDLLQKIIHAYAQAKSCAMTIEHHNSLLERLTKTEIALRDLPTKAGAFRVVDLKHQVTDYSSALDDSLKHTRAEFDILLPAIYAAIAQL